MAKLTELPAQLGERFITVRFRIALERILHDAPFCYTGPEARRTCAVRTSHCTGFRCSRDYDFGERRYWRPSQRGICRARRGADELRTAGTAQLRKPGLEI